VAAARALARAYPDLALPIWGAAALIALVQLPAAAHYPSDIAAGALIGLLGEEATQRAADAVAGGSALDRHPRRRPDLRATALPRQQRSQGRNCAASFSRK
jgi:hypothetical protein